MHERGSWGTTMNERTEFRYDQSIEFRHDPAVEDARRVAFAIHQAAAGLEVRFPSSATLDERLDAILDGAAHTPAAVTPAQFELVYRLRFDPPSDDLQRDIVDTGNLL